MALVPFPSPQSGALPIPPDEDDDNPAAGRMSFLEHLDELRKRIVNSAIAIGVRPAPFNSSSAAPWSARNWITSHTSGCVRSFMATATRRGSS